MTGKYIFCRSVCIAISSFIEQKSDRSGGGSHIVTLKSRNFYFG